MKLGVFDSGVGGLTFASAIKQKNPGIELVYFGDTVHLPYGDKSAEVIISFSTEISQFLINKECDAILIACNSASTVAYDELVKNTDISVPVFNVIDPVIESLSHEKSDSVIGIIGTRATIGSKVYRTKIKSRFPELEVQSYPTPLLAPMVEDGFINDNISRGVVEKYLGHENLKGITCLILGCTHYPIIEHDFIAVLDGNAHVINPVEIVADYLSERLKEEFSSLPGKDHFYVSDLTESFESMTELFFGSEISLEEINLEKV